MGILQSQRIYDIQEENTTLRADNARLTAELATANERIAALEAERDAAVAALHDAECAVSDLSCELRGIPPKRDAARAGKAGE